jgi:YcfA-like protein.
MQDAKIMQHIMSGKRDANIKFAELQRILIRLGFKQHIKGDHYIYTKDTIQEIINIQPLGNKAKAYQVKQVRRLILKYRLEVL